MQTGRYADALEVNVLASQADEGYITQCRAQGLYPLNYYSLTTSTFLPGPP